MAFFDDLSKKITLAGQEAVAKGKEIADVAKLNGQIAEAEKKQNEIYQKIGRKYVELHRGDCEDVFADWLVDLGELKEKISELKVQLAEAKGAASCPGCGSPVDKDADFCPKCGQRMN